jgi:F-type H+-transporting ATPase subunit c
MEIVNNVLKMCLIGFGVLFILASPAMAQEEGQGQGSTLTTLNILAGAGFGCGLVLLGAGYGIGRIGCAAVESMARQPEVAGRIQTAMIITAALIEGATFFGLIVVLLSILM